MIPSNTLKIFQSVWVSGNTQSLNTTPSNLYEYLASVYDENLNALRVQVSNLEQTIQNIVNITINDKVDSEYSCYYNFVKKDEFYALGELHFKYFNGSEWVIGKTPKTQNITYSDKNYRVYEYFQNIYYKTPEEYCKDKNYILLNYIPFNNKIEMNEYYEQLR